LQIKEVQSKHDEEKAEMENKHRKELACKNKEIEIAKLQNAIAEEEKIEQAINDNEAKYKQKENEHELQRLRIEQENRSLLNQVEKLQKTLENVPPELRGTASEIFLLDELHETFPTDDLVPKKVGVEMAHVVQTILMENGEKITPPIVWDRKTGDKVSKVDIDKAKRYKTIHHTDFCVIVTTRGITKNDSNNSLIGKREGILLVHPSIVVEIARLLRSFIIKMAKQKRSNNAKTSKQVKLYDHLTSEVYAITIETRKDKKLKLDELQRLEEEYHKKTWKARKKLGEDWFKVQMTRTRSKSNL
jgi:hypothetical protein